MKQPKTTEKSLKRKQKSFRAEKFRKLGLRWQKARSAVHSTRVICQKKATERKAKLIHVTPKNFIHFISMFFKHKCYTTSSFILSHETAASRELCTLRRGGCEEKYINCVKLHLKNVSQSPISSTNLYQRANSFFPSVKLSKHAYTHKHSRN